MYTYFPIVIEVAEGHCTGKCYHVAVPQDLPIGIAFKVLKCNVPDVTLAFQLTIRQTSEVGHNVRTS